MPYKMIKQSNILCYVTAVWPHFQWESIIAIHYQLSVEQTTTCSRLMSLQFTQLWTVIINMIWLTVGGKSCWWDQSFTIHLFVISKTFSSVQGGLHLVINSCPSNHKNVLMCNDLSHNKGFWACSPE